jgi:hypothetical protein
MATLNANPNPVVIDNTTNPPQPNAPGVITYEKEPDEELWERLPGSDWARVRTARGKPSGNHPMSLRPGDQYVAGVYAPLKGPKTVDPVVLTTITVCGILKRGRVSLILPDRNEDTGGTWRFHKLLTGVNTHLVLAEASRTPMRLDSNGIPRLPNPDGVPSKPPSLVAFTQHEVELVALLPGNHYFFLAMVTDERTGNWDVLLTEFDTLKRKLTVQFPRIVVRNDGDDAAFSEADVWFSVRQGSDPTQAIKLDEFHLHFPYLDDWSNTGRPYSVGFAHIGVPASVQPGQEKVYVASWGVEDDPVWDERAGLQDFGRELPLPVGRFETVSNGALTIGCYPRRDLPGGSQATFHYDADVLFSVDYVP